MRYLIILFLFPYYLLAQQPLPCEMPEMMAASCSTACTICNIDGFTGRNDEFDNFQTLPNGVFCTTTQHNMSYIAFVAGSVDIVISMSVSNCGGNSWVRGLEIGIFKTDDCINFTEVSNCDGSVRENSSATLRNREPLIIGQHYFLIMDGNGGSICDWSFDVLSGSTSAPALTNSGNITGDLLICPSSTANFTTDHNELGAAIYYWFVDGMLLDDNSKEISHQFEDPGNYSVCVTAANVCDQAPTTCETVVVSALEPTIIDTTLCEGDVLILEQDSYDTAGSYFLEYQTGDLCDSIVEYRLELIQPATQLIGLNLCSGEEFYIGNVAYSETGMHQEILQTADRCDSLVLLDLFIIECELIGQVETKSPTCLGEINGSINFSIQQGTAPFEYSWYNILDPSIAGDGNTVLQNNNEISSLPSGSYVINVSDDFGNDVVILATVSQPSALSSSFAVSDYSGVEISCHGATDGQLELIPEGGSPNYNFSWDTGATTQVISNLSAGTYAVTLTDNLGCELSRSYVLTEPQPLGFDMALTDPNCDSVASGQIEVIQNEGGTAPYSFAIAGENFSTATSYTGLEALSTQFYMQDANGCIDSMPIVLTAPEIPAVELGVDIQIELGDSIQLQAVTNQVLIDEFIWSPVVSLSCEDCLDPTATPYTDTNYGLTVTSEDGCSAYDEVLVRVQKIDRLFFPNIINTADPQNNRFYIYTGRQVQSIKYLNIYDRWGGLIYHIENSQPNDDTIGWDGRKGRQECNSGIYVWTAELITLDGLSEVHSGTFTLFN